MNNNFMTLKGMIENDQSLNLIDDRIVLSTHCLYDGGDQVNVYFHPDKNNLFTVSDNGEGYDYLLGLGYELNHVVKSANKAANSYGVIFDEKSYSFKLKDISVDKLFAASLFVSNASQFWVNKIISDYTYKSAKDFNEELFSGAEKIFGKNKVAKNYEIIGESNKAYKIHTAIMLEGKTIFIEGISNEASSINSAFTKYFDVKEAANLNKIAVIKSKRDFAAENINLMRQVSDFVLEEKEELNYLQKIAL